VKSELQSHYKGVRQCIRLHSRTFIHSPFCTRNRYLRYYPRSASVSSSLHRIRRCRCTYTAGPALPTLWVTRLYLPPGPFCTLRHHTGVASTTIHFSHFTFFTVYPTSLLFL